MLGASSEEVSGNILINSTVAQMRKEKCAALNGTVKFWRVGVGLRCILLQLPHRRLASISCSIMLDDIEYWQYFR